MAEERQPFTLKPEDEAMLRALQGDIDHARFELDRAKRIGIDVSELEEQLERAVQLRDDLLKTYGKKE